ncbi:hypothetical protein BX616_000495 [Lobosporangium transversale]|nr:hypothetical protein BX616_000495 [Lobosporangium transversale]
MTSTLPTTFSSPTNTLAMPTPTSVVDPASSATLFPPANKELLCDWIRSAADCRDADFIRNLLITSSVMHGLVFLFGLWLLIFRNRGFNSRIVTELFTQVGTGLRPKPMDCIIFFTGLASLIKVGVNMPVIFDVFKDRLWIRIAIEQTYWIFVAIGFSSYFVGLLYAMPVTTREGIFAIYQPETTFDSRPLPPIHVLTPTTVQKNFLLVMGVVYPAVFGAGAGVASAVFAQMPGYGHLSEILLIVQYSNWVLILWAMAIMFFYYGLKYTFILRANIIIAEAALKAPKAAFGISNLRSSSPARFLFIQLQLTGFGGALVTLLAGSLCMIWVICRKRILAMEHDGLPHTMAFFWTCAIAVAFFAIMALIAVQSVRNRRRGLHDPATSMTHSLVPTSSGQKSSPSNTKNMYSSPNQKGSRSSPSDPEAPLTLRDSAELSTLRSANSMEKGEYEGDSFDLADHGSQLELMEVVSIHDTFSESNKPGQEGTRKVSLGSSARPFSLMEQENRESMDSNTTFCARGSDRSRSPDLRSTVFGGQPLNRPNSPPLPAYPPTASSPRSPSFPLKSIRPSSRQSKGSSSDNKSGTSKRDKSRSVSSSNGQNSQATDRMSSISTSSQAASTTSLSTTTSERQSTRTQRREQQRTCEAQKQQYQRLQHHGSGLTPPPRTQRIPSIPKAMDANSLASPARVVSPPAAVTRSTFMITDVKGDHDFQLSLPESTFTPTPQEENDQQDPSWLLTPYRNS